MFVIGRDLAGQQKKAIAERAESAAFAPLSHHIAACIAFMVQLALIVRNLHPVSRPEALAAFGLKSGKSLA